MSNVKSIDRALTLTLTKIPDGYRVLVVENEREIFLCEVTEKLAYPMLHTALSVLIDHAGIGRPRGGLVRGFEPDMEPVH